MRSLDSEVLDALEQRTVEACNLVWLTGRNRSNNNVETLGLWSGYGTITAPVIDGFTRSTVDRVFIGAGELIQVPDIPLVADLSIRSVELALSIASDEIDQQVRGYDVKYQPVQIYRGLFDPGTGGLIAAAFPRFVGFVDTISIPTGPEGADNAMTLTCVSHTRELTRASAEVRSDASQQRRAPGDDFFRYAGTVPAWSIWWGKEQGKAGD